MLLHGTQRVNERGHLEIGGCDALDLVASFGTPLYVMDEELIRSNCRKYVRAFAAEYGDALVLYASKAFMSMAMCRIIEQEKMGLDVVSGGEIYTAVKAGFPTDKIYFHGNNKSAAEIDEALDAGLGRFIVDNDYELGLISAAASARGIDARILFRITPGIKPKTHSYIQTGQIDSKFGLGIENGLAMAAVKKALKLPGISLYGFHCHIGSQIFGMDSYAAAVEVMMDFLAAVRRETAFTATELNIGGGLGIRYIEEHDPAAIEEHAAVVARAVKRKADQLSLPLPRLLVEPGRSIVGTAGTTLYRVGSVKDIPGIRKYVAVDGGMGDNPRPALYDARYQAIVANKANNSPDEVVSVAGKCCESGDMLLRDVSLPPVEPGDILAVQCTGAYNYSMASNYNRLTVPGTVLVGNGQAKMIVRPQSYADLIACDMIPEGL